MFYSEEKGGFDYAGQKTTKDGRRLATSILPCGILTLVGRHRELMMVSTNFTTLELGRNSGRKGMNDMCSF